MKGNGAEIYEKMKANSDHPRFLPPPLTNSSTAVITATAGHSYRTGSFDNTWAIGGLRPAQTV